MFQIFPKRSDQSAAFENILGSPKFDDVFLVELQGVALIPCS